MHILAFRAIAAALDQLEVAMCAFDSQDRTLLWNQTFLEFFPEHAGHIFEGEDYRENLRRFYSGRLSAVELPSLERYVEDGVERHRTQRRAYEFDHRGYRVRVASFEIGTIGRTRFWRKTTLLPVSPVALNSLNRISTVVSNEVADALECIADGALIVDAEGRAIWANRHFRELYGVSGQKILSRKFEEIYQDAWRHGEPSKEFHAARAALKDQLHFSGAPYELPLPGQRWTRVVEQTGATPDGRSYLSHVDITALKRQQAQLLVVQSQLEALATTDVLTDLPNRRSFDDCLDVEWRRARRAAVPLTLFMIDVDDFKQLNDLYGHATGDLVLRQIAHSLAASLRRAGDIVARYGGEEFAVLLPRTDLDTGLRLAQTACASIRSLVAGDGRTGPLRVSISIGVATALSFEQEPAGLMALADKALYAAKHAGKDQAVVSRPLAA